MPIFDYNGKSKTDPRQLWWWMPKKKLYDKEKWLPVVTAGVTVSL